MQNGGFVNKIQGVRLSVAKIHRHVFENPGFMEYKKHKEALIIVVADRYKGKIPDSVYKVMINWKIEIDD